MCDGYYNGPVLCKDKSTYFLAVVFQWKQDLKSKVQVCPEGGVRGRFCEQFWKIQEQKNREAMLAMLC